MPLKHKRIYASYFYLVLAVVSIFSVLLYFMDILSLLAEGKEFVMSKINLIIAFYVLFYSLISGALAGFLGKRTRVVARQLKDEQISRNELTLVLILAPIIYLLLRIDSNPQTSIVVAYFITTSIINAFRKVLPGVVG